MPPVLGPSLPSPRRLKSWAGTRGTARSPSHTQNRETSGPSRKSSMTTVPPGRERQCSAWARAAFRSSVTTTPLPAARASSLTTWGAPSSVSAAPTWSIVWQVKERAVATPAAAMTSLAKLLEASSSAAARDGPKQGIPAAVTASATPATRGASGPTTTRSTPCAWATRATASGSVAVNSTALPNASMPGLPAWTTRSTESEVRTRARASACSRPPVPTRRTFTAPQ